MLLAHLCCSLWVNIITDEKVIRQLIALKKSPLNKKYSTHNTWEDIASINANVRFLDCYSTTLQQMAITPKAFSIIKYQMPSELFKVDTKFSDSCLIVSFISC